MKKKIAKEEVLQACLQKQEALVESFKSRVNEMKDDTTGQNESASQTEDRTAGKIELMVTLEKELAFVTMEMGYLKSINPSQISTKVEPGALVITNQRNFFIAVSSEKIEINGEIIFGISTNAPIYLAMQELGKGDKFEYNGTAYEIEEIY